MFIFFIISIISFLYLLIIAYIFVGLCRKKQNPIYISQNKNLFLSVLIPFKNEEHNLNTILNNLSQQSLNQNFFEIILINDNSNDNSVQIANKFKKKFKHFEIINQKKSVGKKNALIKGINRAKGQIIVTTDADCSVQKNWLETIKKQFDTQNIDMLIMPVIYNINKKLLSFENFQALEFLSLTASTCGFANLNNPIMCNAANLAYKKSTIQNSNDPLFKKHISGDDTFLMFFIKKIKKKSIKCLNNKNVIVRTAASKNLKSFINQRIRWASKTKFYKDFSAITTAIITLLENTQLFISFWLAILQIISIKYFILTITIKSIIDFPTMFYITKKYNQKKLLWLFLPEQFVYFNYIFIIGILAQFSSFKWKNIRYKN